MAKITKRLKRLVKLRNERLRVHKEGRVILISLFALLVGINMIFYFIGNKFGIGFIVNLFISVAAFCFFMYFFRSPLRLLQINDDGLVVAPADGRIVAIEPVEVQEYFNGKKMMQISIFMSVFSVHANWYPLNGTIKYVRHNLGRYVAAYLQKSSHENEHTTTVIETKTGHEIIVRQIAGALARRIVTYASPCHEAEINHHLGFIKFGSRVDVFLPMESEIFVQLNEHTTGNETIIARIPD